MGEKQQYEEITVELVELQTFSEYVLRRLKCTKADSQVSSSLKGTLWSGVYTSGNRQVAVERGLCEAEFIQAATARLQLKEDSVKRSLYKRQPPGCSWKRLKWSLSGRQLPGTSGREPILHALFLQPQANGNQWSHRFELTALLFSSFTLMSVHEYLLEISWIIIIGTHSLMNMGLSG